MFRKHFIYTVLLFIYFFIMGYLLLTLQKGQFELVLNSLHSPVADLFFKYWTYMGDGWICAGIIISLFIFRLYYGAIALVAVLIKTSIVQYLKQYPFHNEPRPFAYFRSSIDVTRLNFVDGVEMLEINSFPSGHTATAFCIATLLALFIAKETVKNGRVLQVLLFSSAVLVGISRNYLFLHFIADTFAGAIIGCSIAYIVFFVFEAFPKLKSSNFYTLSIINKKLQD